MEMDEVITQIQRWRQLRPVCSVEPEDDIVAHSAYRSQAYDTLFANRDSAGPETVDGAEGDCTFEDSRVKGAHKERQYVADEEMIQKVQYEHDV